MRIPLDLQLLSGVLSINWFVWGITIFLPIGETIVLIVGVVLIFPVSSYSTGLLSWEYYWRWLYLASCGWYYDRSVAGCGW